MPAIPMDLIMIHTNARCLLLLQAHPLTPDGCPALPKLCVPSPLPSPPPPHQSLLGLLKLLNFTHFENCVSLVLKVIVFRKI